jgi:hypothetical protein
MQLELRGLTRAVTHEAEPLLSEGGTNFGVEGARETRSNELLC